jgi:glycosyltransferase involved in cell wall biosynthesis
MRILLVAHAFPPTFGGVETHLWDLSRTLVGKGHTVFCLVGGNLADDDFSGVIVHREPALTVGNLVETRQGLSASTPHQRLLAELERIATTTVAGFGPDLVHMHNAHHFAPELAMAFFQVAGRPLLNSVHDRVGEHVFPDVLQCPWGHTLFASRYLQATLPQPRGPSSVLHLGIDLQQFSPEGEADDRLKTLQRPVIFHPARLLRWKGVALGLQAFGQLRGKLGKGSLVLCGSDRIVDDPYELRTFRSELASEAANAGLAEAVHFLDFERTRFASAYRACDLVWYPTLDEEPFGLVPLEAMACGIPLIVSASGGMRETVVSGRTGLIVPKGDIGALAGAAERLLNDRQLRIQCVAGGLEQAKQFDIQTYARKVERVYQTCVPDRSRS